ncbi:MAG: hypothetical protein AAB691_03505 [Patescibacteria group bacterium]
MLGILKALFFKDRRYLVPVLFFWYIIVFVLIHFYASIFLIRFIGDVDIHAYYLIWPQQQIGEYLIGYRSFDFPVLAALYQGFGYVVMPGEILGFILSLPIPDELLKSVQLVEPSKRGGFIFATYWALSPAGEVVFLVAALLAIWLINYLAVRKRHKS